MSKSIDCQGSRWVLVLILGLLGAGCSKPATKTVATKLPGDDELRQRIDRAIDFTYANRHLNTKDQAGWQVVHGALAYGRDFQVYHDGKLVSALDHLLGGGPLRGWTM
ncbi:MAG TPA: ADP-ribosylation factor-directed GTPase activating protein isoform b, partial [Pirellulales bacterium]|nr:ADP-ribosylation factor-directed GTPase activating protein isoform b [Pirellulales bacterium]